MKILVPVLSGRENDPAFVNEITSGVDEVLLLQIVDKEFSSRAGSAVGEVRSFRLVLDDLKKEIGKKRKKCVELTEWGATVSKIVSIALLHKVDKVVFVSQSNHFFLSILEALKKKRVQFELVVLPDLAGEVQKKKKGLW